MPLLSLPPELIAKILRLVTPPLPVPTSASTFLPEILEERGDNWGEWKDIGTLMLVSKEMSTHAAPFFWSHVEVASSDSARQADGVLSEHPDLAKLVLSVSFCAPPADTDLDLERLADVWDALYDKLEDIQHVTFQDLTSAQVAGFLPVLASYARPLVSISGVPLSRDLYPILVMLLEFTKESLLHLSILPDEIRTPWCRGKAKLKLPKLLSLSVGKGAESTMDDWLVSYLQGYWKCPSVQKRGLGFESVKPRALNRLLGAPSCIQHAVLAHLLNELAHRQRQGHPQPKEVVLAMPGRGADVLQSEDAGRSPFHSVERLIVVQERRDFWNSAHDGVDARLTVFTRTMTLANFPDLRSVIWVLPEGITRGTSLWPEVLVDWMILLTKSSVDLKII